MWKELEGKGRVKLSSAKGARPFPLSFGLGDGLGGAVLVSRLSTRGRFVSCLGVPARGSSSSAYSSSPSSSSRGRFLLGLSRRPENVSHKKPLMDPGGLTGGGSVRRTKWVIGPQLREPERPPSFLLLPSRHLR